jgi:exonuclease SbcC
MLNRVKLTCFQQHRELEVKLGPGLTAIRGANESGKSTLLRGICYAMFGVKAMPDTLDNLVTWGEDVKKLRSEVEFTAEGVVYVVSRGKSGAELNYTDASGNAQKVTGQNEVTNFVARLLRVDANAAPKLMLSNQNEIRGALEAGPKETTALIERLSEFGLIDEIIKLIETELTTGATTKVEAALAAAQSNLETARAAAVEPDLTELAAEIDYLEHAAEKATQGLDICQQDAERAKDALAAGKAAAAERDGVLKVIAEIEQRYDEIGVEMKKLSAVPAPADPGGRTEALRRRISNEEQRAQLQARHDRVREIDAEIPELEKVGQPVGDVGRLRLQLAHHEQALVLRGKWNKVLPHLECGRKFDANQFKGSIERLEAEIQTLQAKRREGERLADAKHADARLIEQQVTAGACGFCGQDFSEVPEVKVKNEKLTADAAALRQAADALWEQARQDGAEADRLAGIRDVSKPVLKVLAECGDVAALSDDVLPPRLKWTASPYSEELSDPKAIQDEIEHMERGQRAYERAQTKLQALREERARLAKDLQPVASTPEDVRALKRQIRAIEEEVEAYQTAIARLGALAEEMSRLGGRLEEAREHLTPEVDLAPLEAAVAAARGQVATATQAARDAQAALSAAQLAKRDAVAAYDNAKALVKLLEAQVTERREELEDMRFNNGLAKAVKAARPLIADKLWNMVLAAVSRYFSEMRGVPSVVTKGQDGFMVDGHVVSTVTLSGSALDILGLAIRVALVKTFLPACPFFVLDEPAQGCDDNRTANLLSFLSACGFSQVLLVTHEDTSESVAQNMITIGA